MRLSQKAHPSLTHFSLAQSASERVRFFPRSRFGLLLIAIALVLLHPSFSFAQVFTPIALAGTEQKRVQLSESVRVEFLIVAPAPLLVESPEQLLAPETQRDWKIEAVGRPMLMPLFGFPGMECWLQTYRLDPYVAGNSLQIEFAPVKVNGKEIAPKGFEIAVLSSLTEVTPESARPVTGIEQLPPPPTVSSSSPMWWVVAVVAILALVMVAWRFRHRPKPIPPGEWAVAAFERLEREGVSGAVLVEGVAMVLRGFIDRRFGIPAPKLTTLELLVAAEQAGWPVEETDALRRLLEICDRAKFAGDIPRDDGCRDLLSGGRDWVNRISSDARPG
jgi:hypothetical protein